MSNRKTTAEKLEAAKQEKEQAEARIKKLMREQNAEKRKERDRRIYKRGGLIESLLPDVVALSDEQFNSFMHLTIANKFGKDKLALLITDGEIKAATANPIQNDAATEQPQPAKTSVTGNSGKTQTVA